MPQRHDATLYRLELRKVQAIFARRLRSHMFSSMLNTRSLLPNDQWLVTLAKELGRMTEAAQLKL